MLSKLFTAAALLATSALAQTPQTAIITITTSHGGAGNGLTNQTVTVPLNTPFRNDSALSAVSYLYLTGATGVPFDSVTCQAYQDADASEAGGDPFNSTTPALLSTNTVQVGSIVCTTTYLAMAPPGGNFSTSILATSTSNLSTSAAASSRTTATSSPRATDAAPVTSVFVTTMSATGGEPATQRTVTSVYVPEQPTAGASPTDQGGDQGAEPSGSATASASPSLSTPNVGSGREIGAEVYAGLAVAWLGVAYVL